MSDGHGGFRSGAGRKGGVRNKRTAAMLAEAKAAGQLPHEFLLAVSRGETIGDYTPSFDERLDAAKAAAPFYAPKLASIDQNLSGNVGTYQAIPVSERDPVDAAAGAAGSSDQEASGQ